MWLTRCCSGCLSCFTDTLGYLCCELFAHPFSVCSAFTTLSHCTALLTFILTLTFIKASNGISLLTNAASACSANVTSPPLFEFVIIALVLFGLLGCGSVYLFRKINPSSSPSTSSSSSSSSSAHASSFSSEIIRCFLFLLTLWSIIGLVGSGQVLRTAAVGFSLTCVALAHQAQAMSIVLLLLVLLSLCLMQATMCRLMMDASMAALHKDSIIVSCLFSS